MTDKSSVSFEDIKSQIINHLSENEVYKSYNFTAPAINMLIDALAYTTQYLITYANFSLNECFLDSAQLRHNVVSHAKELGYIPHQYTAARTRLHLTLDETKYSFVEDNIAKLKIPANTQFLATSGTKSFVFRTLTDVPWTKDENGKFYGEVDAYEGQYITDTFVYDTNSRIYLSNNNIDTDFTEVQVFNDNETTIGETYKLASSIADFGPSEKLYYFQEAYNEQLEIYFGDGVMSKELKDGNYVVVKYFTTSGDEANNIKNYKVKSNHAIEVYKKGTEEKTTDIPTSDFTITVIEEYSKSGGGKEDVESIRFNAPKFYQSQDRCVTVRDYNALVLQKFGGWINSIVSWGGEDNETVDFGSVYLCIKPKYAPYISETQKETIKSYLKNKNLPCIDVKFANPVYITLLFEGSIDWDIYKTTKTTTELKNLILEKVYNFYSENSETFEISYKFSQLLDNILSVDKSIEGVVPTIKLQQTFLPSVDFFTNYTFRFFNRIKKESVLIGPWKVSTGSEEYKITDTFEGKLYYYKGYNNLGEIGSVDYANGIVKINQFAFPDNYYVSTTTNYNVPVTIETEYYNINTKMNYLIDVDEGNINIVMEGEDD